MLFLKWRVCGFVTNLTKIKPPVADFPHLCVRCINSCPPCLTAVFSMHKFTKGRTLVIWDLFDVEGSVIADHYSRAKTFLNLFWCLFFIQNVFILSVVPHTNSASVLYAYTLHASVPAPEFHEAEGCYRNIFISLCHCSALTWSFHDIFHVYLHFLPIALSSNIFVWCEHFICRSRHEYFAKGSH
jgi:hypothetical protein